MTGKELISTQSLKVLINPSKFPVLPVSICFLLQCILKTQDFEYAIFLNQFVKGPIVYYYIVSYFKLRDSENPVLGVN